MTNKNSIRRKISKTQIKEKYRSVSIIANNQVVLNIKGNRFRIVAAINYEFSIVYIRFVGTHQDYEASLAEI